MIGLHYIGRKAMPFTDPLYKTGFVWETKDSVVWVEEAVAAKFLKHPDAWCRAEKAPPKNVTPEKPLPEVETDETEVETQAPLIQLGALNKTGLIEFAQRHFGQKLPTRMTEDSMRERIRNWMNSPVVGG